MSILNSDKQYDEQSYSVVVDIWSSDTWSRIGGNTSRRDQSHVNTRHEVLDWFGDSRGVIDIHLVLMYYAIKIGSSFFRDLSGPSRGCFPDCPQDVMGMFFSSFSPCPRCESIISIYS
jgi:hypothetical protein